MKKAISITLIAVLIVTICGFGGYMAYLYFSSQDKLTEDEKNEIIDGEQDKLDEYLTSLEILIKELADQIKKDNAEFEALEKANEELLELVKEQLAENESNIEEIINSKHTALIAMRLSLSSLKTQYEIELVSLNESLDEMNITIAELEEIGGNESELGSLYLLKMFLEKDIGVYEKNIQSLTKQIADLDDVLNQLDMAVAK